MCKAFADHMERGRREGRQEGRREGRQEGQIMILYDLIKEGILTLSEAAGRLALTEKDFLAMAEGYRATK